MSGAVKPINPSFARTSTIDLLLAASIDYIVKSVSYEKKHWQGPTLQSFFWYDNDNDLKERHFCGRQLIKFYSWAVDIQRSGQLQRL